MRPGPWKFLAALLLCAALAGCVGLPPARTLACEDMRRVETRLSADASTASATITVLTYNVEGLPGSLRRERPAALKEIGERLAALRGAGKAPDIVLFQEVFSRSARQAVLASGYPSLTPGPTAGSPVPPSRNPSLPGRPDPRRGELGLKFASSGIVIASEFPVVARGRQAFARGSCAGRDCLANKGLVFARIMIPGVPGTIDLFNTHLNSMGASWAPQRRHHAAHRKQIQESMGFLAAREDPSTPTIFGGDFNMRGSDRRFSEFAYWKPLTLVHRYCTEQPQSCDVRMSWDGDEPWMDTQDLQLFGSGDKVEIRPMRVEALFDGRADSPRLSDHDGLLVTYKLSWPADLTPSSPCG